MRVQGDSMFRRNPEDISKLFVRNKDGKMIPLGSLINARYEVGPMRVDRLQPLSYREDHGSKCRRI